MNSVKKISVYCLKSFEINWNKINRLSLVMMINLIIILFVNLVFIELKEMMVMFVNIDDSNVWD